MSEAVNITTLDIKRSTLTEQAVDTIEDSPRQFANFAEFYPFYLSQHENKVCRRLHFVGSTLGLVGLSASVITGKKRYIAAGIVAGYGCAWVGHFFFEKNKPATFTYPVYSFMGDWVMYAQSLGIAPRLARFVKSKELQAILSE
ncbi:MAG TPA: DUF962 domain-containing protein [Agitococcus sp.]|nr:DUF962 domain-containing protein [Agitococcus sp.]